MEFSIKKILVPIDFSENSKSAVKYAHIMAQTFGAELVFIYVLEPILYPPDFSLGQITLPAGEVQEFDKRAHEELKKISEEEISQGITVTTIVRSGKPFLEIIETAKERDIDLIIISSHGHSGVENILFGSTSEKVVRKAPCPVLTLRDPIKGFDYKTAFSK